MSNLPDSLAATELPHAVTTSAATVVSAIEAVLLGWFFIVISRYSSLTRIPVWPRRLISRNSSAGIASGTKTQVAIRARECDLNDIGFDVYLTDSIILLLSIVRTVQTARKAHEK
jgi:hypothetical protein